MTTTDAAPTFEQVLQLPPVLEARVTPDWIDVNGHMNIRHYLDQAAHGADQLCRRVGIDDAYRAERRLGVFTAEHHLRYTAEMHEGDALTTHTLWLDRSARAGHLMSFVVDRTDEVVACTVEIVLVHVDMDTRRPAPFPDDVAAGLDELVEAARAVTWPVPLCGAMGIRR